MKWTSGECALLLKFNRFNGKPCNKCGNTLRYEAFPFNCTYCTRQRNSSSNNARKLARRIARIVKLGESW